MDFPINPVSPQEESLDLDVGNLPPPGKNKWDALDGAKVPAKCTNIKKTSVDGKTTVEFEFIGTEGQAAGLTFWRKASFPEFAGMILATAKAMGVEPVKGPDGKTNLPLEQCKGRACELDLKRNKGSNGKTYTNIAYVNPPKAGAATPANGPTIL